jgi:hypothetical protein
MHCGVQVKVVLGDLWAGWAGWDRAGLQRQTRMKVRAGVGPLELACKMPVQLATGMKAQAEQRY